MTCQDPEDATDPLLLQVVPTSLPTYDHVCAICERQVRVYLCCAAWRCLGCHVRHVELEPARHPLG